ncbi:E3 ubiquitin-protein ligase znrf2-like isoform X1 [Silurus meridionalis]|uniref:E3 ubiquitin-protein ligase znrf2-like isoform X1 n=1 Tax=Silurus meridionalis TaxID=175797 RepID=UPI001EEBEC7B|nr:E3 ubiquitin-protein ligase znrf2-like isoform X1 [Silurus meridionalis]
MGPKQSSPAASARLRAYSGSDVPSPTSTAAGSGSASATAIRYYTGNQQQVGANRRYPADSARPNSLFQPTSIIAQGGGPRSDEDPHGERSQSGPRLLIGSLPAHLSPHLLGAGFNCPVCSKFVASDEIDLHLVMCLTKPRLTYNDLARADFALFPKMKISSKVAVLTTLQRSGANHRRCLTLSEMKTPRTRSRSARNTGSAVLLCKGTILTVIVCKCK